MVMSTIETILTRYRTEIENALRQAILDSRAKSHNIDTFYGQMQYQLGWVDANLSPVENHSGKLLRPTLLLLAYEAAGAWSLTNDNPNSTTHLHRALPAAASIEFIHNFTLIHDDIEDKDTERRHRPTLWTIWGMPNSINAGDGLFILGRLTLWRLLDEGVDSTLTTQLAALLDRTCLNLSEGQYLDISFENYQDISIEMYLDMINRKTGALISCATDMGALLGTQNQEIIERLHNFGKALGITFQVRDDLLGIWASRAALGKTPAGDIYRRKKSLPILHALENANALDLRFLHEVYAQEAPITDTQIEEIFAILARTQSKAYCHEFLSEQCRLAYDLIADIPRTANAIVRRALDGLEVIIQSLEAPIEE